jgi:gamma-glutamyl:cysteine ligase YbdK (ATP-grasp superfamily)
MIRDRVLTISTLGALMALSSVAQAGPKVTDKTYSPNEVGRSSQSRQTDWNRARAMQRGAPAQIAPEGTGRQIGCRYLYSGGPKNPVTC